MTSLLNKICAVCLLVMFTSGCMHFPKPYTGVNPENPQFERGRVCVPLDIFGAVLSFPIQLMFWNFKYGNHRITPETEKQIADFLAFYELTDVKVRINQWAPHKEVARCYTNKNIAWPYRIFFSISTLITSLIARPFSGLIISDYYDPGSNSINIFSDDGVIGLHEAGHAKDFSERKLKGSYGLLRIVPFVDLAQEYIASDEAIYYLERTGQYDDQLRAYRTLIPAYLTYMASYFNIPTVASLGAVIAGHIVAAIKREEKKRELQARGKIPKPYVRKKKKVISE